jgi:hypothetical protein
MKKMYIKCVSSSFVPSSSSSSISLLRTEWCVGFHSKFH